MVAIVDLFGTQADKTLAEFPVWAHLGTESLAPRVLHYCSSRVLTIINVESETLAVEKKASTFGR